MDLISSTEVYNYIATLIHNKYTHTYIYRSNMQIEQKKSYIFIINWLNEKEKPIKKVNLCKWQEII